MRSNLIKILSIIVLTAVMLIMAAAVSHGSSFRFVMENQGKTWKLANSNYLGSIGLKDLQATSTFTVADIENKIDQGRTVRFYAGKGLTGINEYTQLTSETVFDYTEISGEQQIENAFYVEFEPKKIRFEHFDYHGHKHLHGNIDLGILEQVPAPIPIPPSWILAIAGFAALFGARYRLTH